jgi:DNA polymerase-3 subunit delta
VRIQGRISLEYRHDEAQPLHEAPPLKLAVEELSSHPAGAPLPAYLVSGDEPLLVSEAVDAIRARARAAGFMERKVFFFERANAGWDEVSQEARALSLFSSNRIVEIRLPGGKPGVAGAAALLRLIESAGTDLLLLIITGQLDREGQNAEWVQALQRRGAYVPVRTVERGRLPHWLQSRFAAAGLNANDEAIALLAERSEGNLLAAKQEIDKLALLQPDSSVTAADIAASSADSARFDPFQLVDAVRSSDAARALRILGGLKVEGAQVPWILWHLIREIRMRESRALGSGRTSIARLSARASRADRMAKGLAQGDCWDELALLVVEMTGRRTLPLLRTISYASIPSSAP